LSLPYPQFPTVYIYPTFNEKGLPMTLYKYELNPLLKEQHSKKGSIRPEVAIEKLCLIHKYFHVKTVYQ
jgi:hypothetical protein